METNIVKVTLLLLTLTVVGVAISSSANSINKLADDLGRTNITTTEVHDND